MTELVAVVVQNKFERHKYNYGQGGVQCTWLQSCHAAGPVTGGRPASVCASTPAAVANTGGDGTEPGPVHNGTARPEAVKRRKHDHDDTCCSQFLPRRLRTGLCSRNGIVDLLRSVRLAIFVARSHRKLVLCFTFALLTTPRMSACFHELF